MVLGWGSLLSRKHSVTFFSFFFLVQKVPFIIAWGQDPWAKGAALSVSDFLSCFNSLSLDTAPGLRLHVLRQGKV